MNHYLYKLLLLSVTLFSMSIIHAETLKTAISPLYDGNQLLIPRVDTVEKVGVYEEAIFFYDKEINAWQLQSYNVARDGIEINDIIPLVTSTTPIQVLLQVKGNVLACGNVGKIAHRVVNNKFEVQIHATQFPSDSTCIAAAIPFLKVIPLDVYGLDAGVYEYSVNGSNTGTFQLLQNNKLGECAGIEQCNQMTTTQ